MGMTREASPPSTGSAQQLRRGNNAHVLVARENERLCGRRDVYVIVAWAVTRNYSMRSWLVPVRGPSPMPVSER
jgi:hypothetical protein